MALTKVVYQTGDFGEVFTIRVSAQTNYQFAVCIETGLMMRYRTSVKRRKKKRESQAWDLKRSTIYSLFSAASRVSVLDGISQ